VAQAIAAALQGPELSALQDMLARAHQRATEVLPTLHLPHIPTREEFLREARAMFARTKSLDEIVDRAYELLLISVSTRLARPIESKS
jgi:stearoyl-CoA desaturase (delta-9 desaturase)